MDQTRPNGTSRRTKHRATRLVPAVFEALEARQLMSSTSDLIAVPLGIVASPAATFPTGNSAPPGFSAAQIRHAYGVDSIKFAGITGDGSGQTIAVINAYDNPKFVDTGSSGFANSDLHKFDVAMGLPDPPSFRKVDENGHQSYPSTDPGWANEAALDVEWAHALAPKANILLVEAYSASLTDLINVAVQYAKQQPGVSEISMSFATKDDPSETQYDSYFHTPSGHGGVTFLAASGDNGSAGGYPAYSPNVVSVGATSLSLTSSNTISGETGRSTSGGGISSYENKPGYQYSVTQSSTHRTSPDVAFDGDPNTGVSVYDSFNGGSLPWYKVGGTSFSAPAWAGLVAIANQARAHLGLSSLDGSTQTLPRLYELNSSDFHDITTGSNGYSAQSGYDLVTGRGTPIASKLVTDLAGGNSVSGTIFSDTNGNGKQDSGEGALSGWGTFVDLDLSGTYKGLDPRVVSGSNGAYKFSDLPGGTYRFTQATTSGYKRTTPAFYTITLGYGSNFTGYNIGNQPTSGTQPGKGSISGSIFADVNKNQKYDFGEKGIAGVTVYIDANKNGVKDSGEATAVTNSSGNYTFANLANATYRVREVLPSGKKLTTPTSGYYDVTISNAYNSTGKNFGDA